MRRPAKTPPFPVSPERLTQAVAGQCGVTPSRSVKYVFCRLPAFSPAARVLLAWDYPRYCAFFLACPPDCRDTDWLEGVFPTMTAKGFCHGVFAGGMPVSCTDAPDMPYPAGLVQEIGIHTRPAYRGKGYAKSACLASAQSILKSGRCPQWSTDAENTASQRLALAVGFEKLADVVTATLWGGHARGAAMRRKKPGFSGPFAASCSTLQRITEPKGIQRGNSARPSGFLRLPHQRKSVFSRKRQAREEVNKLKKARQNRAFHRAYQLELLVLSSGRLRLLLTAHAGFFIVFPLANLGQHAGTGALTLEPF